MILGKCLFYKMGKMITVIIILLGLPHRVIVKIK